MKPADYKYPFKWPDRHVLLQDQVFFVPLRLEKEDPFVFPGWNDPALFGNELPVRVEYCSGNGAWIAAKAKDDPGSNWVAIERKFDRVQKIVSKKNNHKLDNLVVLCGEGLNATKRYFPAQSVSEVFINFPDPWPKKRHWKNRIVNQEMIKELHRILKPEGTATFVTDDPPYSAVMIQEMLDSKLFVPLHGAPYFVTELPGYGNSYFEELWRQMGKTIMYHSFRVIA